MDKERNSNDKNGNGSSKRKRRDTTDEEQQCENQPPKKRNRSPPSSSTSSQNNNDNIIDLEYYSSSSTNNEYEEQILSSPSPNRSYLYQYYHQRYHRQTNNNNNNNNNNSNNNNSDNYNNNNNNNNNNICKTNERLENENDYRSNGLLSKYDNVPSTSSSALVNESYVSDLRICPLPPLSWAESSEVWKNMVKKDIHAALERDADMFINHSAILPRMRAILLDWLIEVCEVYKLHRETYYLAIDYLDRYLSLTINLPKARLQLIGITCLFIAAKVEEIYPPKIGEFAYVTDGACLEADIIQEERILLNTLNWHITPVTIMGWLSVYMQLNVSNRSPALTLNATSSASISAATIIHNNNDDNNNNNDAKSNSNSNNSNNINNNNNNDNNNISSFNSNDINCININNITPNKMQTRQQTSLNKHFLTPPSTKKVQKHKVPELNKYDEAFVYPQFSGLEFCQTAQLIDLCSLDHEMANYQYSEIAAAAISHTFNRETAMNVSGLDWDVIRPCANWMLPYYLTICEEKTPLLLLEQNEQYKATFGLSHIAPNMITDDSHVLQTHTTSLDMFDKAYERMLSITVAMNKVIETPTSSITPTTTTDTTETLTHELNRPKIDVTPGTTKSNNLNEDICIAGLLTPPTSNSKLLDENKLLLIDSISKSMKDNKNT